MVERGALDKEPVMEPIPLSQLEVDPQNVRKSVDADGISELAASIDAHGLMQNLVVRRKPRTKSKYLVTAGGRRLAALQQLAEQGAIGKAHEIPCQVLEDANAVETSLAENVSRRDMAPIDAFEAFANLRDGGMSIADIATRFGITEHLVEKRMRLGDLAPELRDAMRAGHLSLDAAMAFARRAEPALQLAVWKELGGKPGTALHASTYSIKRGLDEGGVPSSTRSAQFIGVEAYTAAGGSFECDLFDEDGAGVFTDPKLLERLVTEKLDAEAATVKADGWAWVEVAPELAWDATQGMGRVYPRNIEDPELEAEYASLTEQVEALEEISFEREFTAEEAASFATFEQRMDEIEQARRSEYVAEDKAGAGVFVSINHDGSVRHDYGFIRKEDMKATSARGDRAGSDGADSGPQGPKPWSNALLTNLAAARNEVFQVHLAQAPEAAFDLLVFALATSLLSHGYADTGLTVSTGGGTLPAGDSQSIAATAFLEARDGLDLMWLEADDTGARFAALCALSFEARQAIMAWCVAAMSQPRLSSSNPDHPIEQTGHRIGIDARSLWTPSTDTLFARLSKGQILPILAACAGEDFANRHASMKKGDLVNIADRFFAGDARHHSAETGAKADAWVPDGMVFAPQVLAEDAVNTADTSEDAGNPDTDAASEQEGDAAPDTDAVLQTGEQEDVAACAA